MADQNDLGNPREEDEEETKPWYHVFRWNKKNDQSEDDVDKPEGDAEQPEDEEETKYFGCISIIYNFFKKKDRMTPLLPMYVQDVPKN